MNAISMTSGNNEINAALLDIWCEIALPYEDELEDCFNSIKEQCKLTGDEIMNGDGVLVRHTKGGYIIRTDAGEYFILPRECYKGVNDKCGTRIKVGKTRDVGKRKICVDAMECVCISELKYRMFSAIEKGDMVIAATSARAIYKDAPEPLMHKMRRAIRTLRSQYKRFKIFIEIPVLENNVRLAEV